MKEHRTAIGSVGALVGAALIPKCPFCVAALLSAIGLGTTIAPIVRPAALVVATLALVVSATAMWRARRRRCCARS